MYSRTISKSKSFLSPNRFSKQRYFGIDGDTSSYIRTLFINGGLVVSPDNARKLDNIVRFAKNNNFWNNMALWPCSPFTQAPTGNIIYKLGGLSSAPNFNIFNQSFIVRTQGGLRFLNNSNAYLTATWDAFKNISDLFCFYRVTASVNSVADTPTIGSTLSVGNYSGITYAWGAFSGGGVSEISGETIVSSKSYLGVRSRLGSSFFSFSSGESFIVASRMTGSNNTALWKNKNNVSLNLSTGNITDMSPSAVPYTQSHILFGNYMFGGAVGSTASDLFGFKNNTLNNLCIIDKNLNTYERETMTDLLSVV